MDIIAGDELFCLPGGWAAHVHGGDLHRAVVMRDARRWNETNREISIGDQHTDCLGDLLVESGLQTPYSWDIVTPRSLMFRIRDVHAHFLHA